MTYTLLGMAAKLAAVSINTELAAQMAIEEAASMVLEAAKALIGHPNGVWAALADSTLARKAGDTPLYETGQLKGSIEKTIGHHIAWVGTNDRVAEWQELGTSRIPPRSFIGMAAIDCESAIHKLTTQAIGRALAGHGLGELRELLHALREAVHIIKETGESILEDDDGNKRK